MNDEFMVEVAWVYDRKARKRLPRVPRAQVTRDQWIETADQAEEDSAANRIPIERAKVSLQWSTKAKPPKELIVEIGPDDETIGNVIVYGEHAQGDGVVLYDCRIYVDCRDIREALTGWPAS